MPNHWHFVVKPTTNDQVSEFFRRLTVTQTMRWHAYYKTSGVGHLYRGRCKSFPIQSDSYLLTVLRYVERNPLRANLIEQAEDWKWGSAWARRQKPENREWLQRPESSSLPRQWQSLVNKPQTEAELEALRNCLCRGTPIGDAIGITSRAVRLSLQSTTRARERPRTKLNKET